MIEKLRGVKVPPFQISWTWTIDEVLHFFKQLRLKRRLKRVIKQVKEKNK